MNKDNLVKKTKYAQTPNKTFRTEGNKSIEKFKPNYYQRGQYSVNRKTNQIKSFSNNKTVSSIDKKTSFLPIVNTGQQFLLNHKNDWSIYGNMDDSNERDNLWMQIQHSQNDIKKTNKEIRDLKAMFEIIQKENLANKYLITQLLQKNKKIKEDMAKTNSSSLLTDEMNSENNNNNENDNKIWNNNDEADNKLNDKNNEEVKNINENKKAKAKTNYVAKKEKRKMADIMDRDKARVDVLKQELENYKINLNKKEKKLNLLKEKKEIKQYNHINGILESKNKTLEELIKKSNDMQSQINEIDQKIIDYKLNIFNLKDNSIKKNSKIKYYKKEIYSIENRIQKLKEEKSKIEKNEKRK